jgi:pimeloyl-ACP methyl ester carboxylesterase
MAYIDVDDTRLYYEEKGAGEPVVFVHGGFSDHSTWRLVAGAMPESLRVVTYDRRGHSRSERGAGALPRRLHESDLVGLLEALELGPAHLVGNSYGASIVLGLAARRPDLVQSAVAHEAPLTGITLDNPTERRAVARVEAQIRAALKRIDSGDVPGGVKQFLEDVALGAGRWEQVPERIRTVMVSNAPTVVDEQRDPHGASIGLDELASIRVPVLLTHGAQSPEWFSGVIAKLSEVIPGATPRVLAGAGHNPHATHPAEFAAAVAGFVGDEVKQAA